VPPGGKPYDDEAIFNRPPPRAVPPQHNNTPSELSRRVSKDGYVDTFDDSRQLRTRKKPKFSLQHLLQGKNSARGRKWDHLLSAEPVIVSGHLVAKRRSTWQSFVHSSQYGHIPNEEAEIVDVDMLEKLQPGFNNPMDMPPPVDSRRSRTSAFYKRAWNIILKHPLVPLALRLTVLLTSIIALALSVRIFKIENGKDRSSAERTQAIVAIVVDTVAIPYIGYMTWDEYTGKPLGLRSATQKISLILMDLFFVIFKSASTSLAFEALVYHNSTESTVRYYSRALTAFQTVGLISWTMNLTVNVFRLVQKLGGNDEENGRSWGGHGSV
jgi:hypothetical protein